MCENALAQQQLALAWRWFWGVSLHQAIPWVGKLSGWLLPLAVRVLATAQWITKVVPWALPLEKAQCATGVGLTPVGGPGGDEQVFPEAARSPVWVGIPQ